MSDAEGKLKKLETPGMYGIKMAHPSKAMFTPLPFEGKLFNVPFVEVDTRTDKVRKREGRKKEMVFDQQETYMVAGGKFVSINQVPGGDGDKYESDPYDHPSSFVPFTGTTAAFGSKDASKRDEFSAMKTLKKHREFLRKLESLDTNDDAEDMAQTARIYAEEERVRKEAAPLLYDLINGPPMTAKARSDERKARAARSPGAAAASPNHMWAATSQSYGAGGSGSSASPAGAAPRINFGRVSTTKEFATQGHL